MAGKNQCQKLFIIFIQYAWGTKTRQVGATFGVRRYWVSFSNPENNFEKPNIEIIKDDTKLPFLLCGLSKT
jgi:hypothetical protein